MNIVSEPSSNESEADKVSNFMLGRFCYSDNIFNYLGKN